MADANARRRSKKAPPCPGCQATVTVPIVYGLPSPETFEAAERGEVAIGGCVLEVHNPRWACPACEHRW
jgi:hypothetical protein